MPDPPDFQTDPNLGHQGSHLQSQVLVDRKPPCHDLATGLEGKQQTLTLCLPFDLTPKVQPTGKRVRSQVSWDPKRMRSSWHLFLLTSEEMTMTLSIPFVSLFSIASKIFKQACDRAQSQ